MLCGAFGQDDAGNKERDVNGMVRRLLQSSSILGMIGMAALTGAAQERAKALDPVEPPEGAGESKPPATLRIRLAR